LHRFPQAAEVRGEDRQEALGIVPDQFVDLDEQFANLGRWLAERLGKVAFEGGPSSEMLGKNLAVASDRRAGFGTFKSQHQASRGVSRFAEQVFL
jgi:hypothetical protein